MKITNVPSYSIKGRYSFPLAIHPIKKAAFIGNSYLEALRAKYHTSCFRIHADLKAVVHLGQEEIHLDFYTNCSSKC